MKAVVADQPPRRTMGILVVLLGIGLGAALFLLREAQQDRAVERGRVGHLQDDLDGQQRLVGTLQKQVTTLCGGRPGCVPATAAPQPTGAPAPVPSATAAAPAPRATASGSRPPSPRPSPPASHPSSSPTARPQPSPTPTPTSTCQAHAGPVQVCLGGQS